MSKSSLPMDRRRFLKTTVATSAAVAAPAFVPGSALGKDGAVAPSERIVVVKKRDFESLLNRVKCVVERLVDDFDVDKRE